MSVLEPGESLGLYHAEPRAQEDFLVVAGRCLLLVEEQERELRAWDFVHCPPGTRHIVVGAGERALDRRRASARAGASRSGVVYPVSEARGRARRLLGHGDDPLLRGVHGLRQAAARPLPRRAAAVSVPEAGLDRTPEGLVPEGEGWFVLNAREARWQDEGPLGVMCFFEGDVAFPQLGINLNVLEPGQPMCMYHWEADQEDFLVLSGEALLIVEGEERPLRAWDFVHCPPGTKHVIVGAGEGPCVDPRRRRARAVDRRGLGCLHRRRDGAPPRRGRPRGDHRAGGRVRAVPEARIDRLPRRLAGVAPRGGARRPGRSSRPPGPKPTVNVSVRVKPCSSYQRTSRGAPAQQSTRTRPIPRSPASSNARRTSAPPMSAPACAREVTSAWR